MFSSLAKTNFNISVTAILLSANGFNLDLSEILSFGKELKPVGTLTYQTLMRSGNNIYE